MTNETPACPFQGSGGQHDWQEIGAGRKQCLACSATADVGAEHRPSNQRLADALEDAAHRVGRGDALMSIPARPDYDADLLMMEAARRLKATDVAAPAPSNPPCDHKDQVAGLADRFMQWKGYDCPYCEIERLRCELTLAERKLRIADVATAGCICRSVPTIMANPDCPIHGDGD